MPPAPGAVKKKIRLIQKKIRLIVVSVGRRLWTAAESMRYAMRVTGDGTCENDHRAVNILTKPGDLGEARRGAEQGSRGARVSAGRGNCFRRNAGECDSAE